MSMNSGLSGLNAASKNLDVIGNNIANSQTVGFKSSKVQFADVYANKVGMGVGVAGVIQNFNNGNLEATGRNLDLAIGGDGFFQFSQNGETVYSRNGQVKMTPEGFLENAQGARLIGPNGPIQISNAGMLSNATTKVASAVNVDSREPIITAAFNMADPDTYSYANTANTYDSLGNQHTVTLYYTKTGVNQWSVRAGMDGAMSASAPQPLNFTTNGSLNAYAPTNFQFPMTNGANNIDFTMDFKGSTQFGSDNYQNTLVQDGYTNGQMIGVTFDKDGSIMANYSNEQKVKVGTIQLANFLNPEGLKPLGDNVWAATTGSGQAVTGTAGVGRLGTVESGVLEASNSDTSHDLVDLIVAQRNYQANAQTIKSQDEILQQAINLR
ncbi:flagellar hook protein FlgE [Pseudomonas serbica]|uniref:flagellar hook protein FlgE n=1 Tax=Pseudomonas serbica TaxID=2965074 RepID=UPI00237C4B46|nr:flagellar hook protein FlgE [Pseudomonas serbica]